MLKLSDREWKEFKAGDLFTIVTGKAYNKNKMRTADRGLKHVQRATSNHGIDCYAAIEDADNYIRYKGNCITVSSIPYVDGTCAFYQDDVFCCGVGVNILTNDRMNRELALFICNCINNAVIGKYGMARSLGAAMLANEILSIPVTSNGQPDYDFMEQYIREREPDYSWATRCVKPDDSISLQDRQWKEFNLTDIFDTVNRGKRLTKAKRQPGKTPLITAGFLNYGVGDYIQNPDQTRFRDAVTIDMFGNAFYRGTEFCCDDNIIVLQNDSISSWVKLFITPIVNMRKSQYSYGNQYRLGDLATHTVKLPVDDQGNPDYDFMERYMKSLPFSAAVA